MAVIKKKMQMGGKAKPMSGKVGAYTELEKKSAAGDRQAKLDLAREKKEMAKFGEGPGSGPSGAMPKPKMKMGGSLKPVDKTKKPGLAKLPKAVRNKMGFKKNGGVMSKKK